MNSHRVLKFGWALQKAANKVASEPPKKKESPSRGRPATLMTDDQVLECRRRYEFEGWSCRSLCNEYGMTTEYMRKLLDYSTRSKLIPKKAA